MKKLITTLLVISMIACIIPVMATSAFAATPEITIDGDISDWEGLQTIETIDGDARYTFYGVVTEKGLYVACDAYTLGFDPGTGNWWDAPNLEFFVGPYTGSENQRWVSFTDKDGGYVKEGNVTSAAVSYEAVEGAAANHAIAEAFIAREKLDNGWFYSDGSIRVGMAFDTNNTNPGGAYVRPTGTTERDMRALVTSEGLRSMLPVNTTVSTADELIEYVKTVNEAVALDGIVTKGIKLSIGADIDLTGKEWTPISRWIGTIEGNGHTISGITYETDAESGNYGLLVNDLANYYDYGTIQNVIIKDSVIIAKSTNGYVGAVAGYADRGRVMNCTVDGVAVIGNTVAGGVVGGACWATGSLDGAWVIEIINDTVKDSVIVAVNSDEGKAGGIAGINYWDDIISLGDYTLENVTVVGKTTSATVADAQGRTPPQGAGATSTGVVTSETVITPTLPEGQEDIAWKDSEAGEARISVNAIGNTISAVKINENILNASEYSVIATANGYDIVLSNAYLNTLQTGTYEIVIETYLGDLPGVTLDISADSVPDVPDTGDYAIATVIVVAISVFAMAAVIVSKKRSFAK